MERADGVLGDEHEGDDRRLFKMALEASSNGIVLTDATRDDNPIIYVNPAFEAITGYGEDEVLGRNCRFLQGDDSDQPALGELRDAMREGRECRVVVRNYRKDGTPFYNELHLAPVRDREGRLTNYVGVQNDVTECRDAQEARVRVSAEYEEIIRILPNVVFRWKMGEDGEMYPSYVEGALAEQFGVTTERIAGKRLEEVFPPEFLGTVRPAYERAFAGETVEFSSRIGDRSFANVAMPFEPEGRTPTKEIVGYVTEVTGREKAEEALRKSKERYEVAIRGSNDGIWDWDLTTGEVYLSPRWKEMLGYGDHELESGVEAWRGRIHPEDLERVMSALQEYLDGRTEHYELEHRLLHRDGSYRWILTRGASLRDGSGAPNRMSGSHTDVTGRKELEEQLKHRAFHDGLTGLPNRALFMERLEHALERAGGKDSHIAVLFLDLDGFKEVNDSLGHEAGDELLVEVARRLKQRSRPGDTVARLGGDEFIVLLEEVSGAEDAASLAERVSEGLRAPIELAGREVSVTASIGVALGDPKGVRPQDLVREADNAMYRSKRHGEGLYEVRGAGGAAPRRPAGGVGSTGGKGDPGGERPRSRRRGEQVQKPAGGCASEGPSNGRCTKCETLPEKLAGPGRLYLWLPLDHTLSKTYRHLRAGGWTVETARDYSMVVRLDDGRLTELLSALSAVLTGQESEDTRALFKPGGDELTVSDIPRAQSLTQISSLGGSGWLLDMLSEGRLTSYFQPIVRVEDPSEVFAQECLLRGVSPEGDLVPPTTIFEAAKSSRMLFQTDLAARRTAIREAVRNGVETNLFVNFTPTAVYDPAFCLRSTVEAVKKSGISPERIVFEVTETEETRDVDHLKNIASFYREKGFRVALDDVGSGYSSLNMIHRLRPDFIKLDMHLVRGVDSDPYKALVAGKVLEMARGLGVDTIVEGVETEGEFAWARENGATFAQGYLIARPASSPAGGLARA
ncbi:EAL domain-containing protein [Rubrobacter marinus]|uniref:EAL domain-containing protein n=1 Tax=Rubrobacter marinus TaxID=2653852 RepID=A0A6G8Q0B3_9ACTN|nr:EAL domain-containing protein [Rubrobacter marinus]QIN79868.1 EAL domain-containing protein [Rubrobacter marinus]